MTTFSQIFSEYPIIQTIFDSVCIIVPLSVLLVCAGIYFMTSTAEILCIKSNRAAFNKCAKQLSLLGLILVWGLVIGSRIWLYKMYPGHHNNYIINFTFELSWMLLSMGASLGAIYYFLWNVLRNKPIIHITIGLISAIENSIVLISVLLTIRLFVVISSPNTDGQILTSTLFPDSWQNPVWQVLIAIPALIFAMPGAFGAYWLAIRRKYDDFGRDYYNVMIPWCASWAFNGWLILIILLCAYLGIYIWQYPGSDVLIDSIFIRDSSLLLLWLIPLFCWFYVRKSDFPMRHTWLLLVALLISICFALPLFSELVYII